MSNNFQTALNWIFPAEGHESNHAADRGGLTRFGISLRYLKRKGQAGDLNGDGVVNDLDIRALTREQAVEIYFTDFWSVCRCNAMPRSVALAVFDCAVNQGTHVAIVLLQQVLRVKADGVFGPKTMNAVLRKSNDIIPLYLSRRAMHYRDITLANSEFAEFIQGWLNRLFLLQQFIQKESADVGA